MQLKLLYTTLYYYTLVYTIVHYYTQLYTIGYDYAHDPVYYTLYIIHHTLYLIYHTLCIMHNTLFTMHCRLLHYNEALYSGYSYCKCSQATSSKAVVKALVVRYHFVIKSQCLVESAASIDSPALLMPMLPLVVV